MRFPRRGPDRPPPAVAGPSTGPVVIRLAASVSPEDWRSRSGDGARDADREWSLRDHYGPTASGWCADPRLLPEDAWRNSGAACAGAHLSRARPAGRPVYKHGRSPWE